MRVELQHRLNPRRQPVKAFPHVGDAARQIDAHVARDANHDSADKTCCNTPPSTAPVRRSFTPERSSTSITPFTGRSTVGPVAPGSVGAAATAVSSPTGGATITGANPVN